MACESWRDKLDAYLDGELASADANALSVHLRECSACALDALERVQLKRSVAVAGKRFEPNADFRAKMLTRLAKPRPRTEWNWRLVAVPALLAAIVLVGINWYAGRESARRQRVYSELADLHVSTLASSTPVDVLSTDRHTVKPWFAGKIPFTFNLPELQGTEFTLVGGRVTYLAQTPGAHLIYQVRKHQISVFIFQDRGEETAGFPTGLGRAMSFNTESWTQSGLRYFIVGDVSGGDIRALAKLFRDAG